MALPRPTDPTNLALAQSVMKELKQEVLSTHDIISDVEMPEFFEDEESNYIKKFGKEKINAYKAYLDFSNVIRSNEEFYRELSSLQQKHVPAPGMTLYLANAMSGFGVCADTSAMAIMKLMNSGCKATIYSLVLKGYKSTANGVEPFVHSILVVGDDAGLLQSKCSLDVFKKLSDECVLVDSLQGIVGKANKIAEISKGYVEAFHLNEIVSVTTIDPVTMKGTMDIIAKNAVELSKKFTQKIEQAYPGVLKSLLQKYGSQPTKTKAPSFFNTVEKTTGLTTASKEEKSMHAARMGN